MNAIHPHLFVISGPSGIGLREILSAVLEQRTDFAPVLPVTARKMKEGERDGVGFYFYDLEGWEALRACGDLIECTEFAGNDYGTSRRLVEERLHAGKNVLLNLETERAAQIKKNMPEAVCVYMEPSDGELLRERFDRISRSPFETPVRLREAARQRALSGFCDARVGTDDPEQAARELNALIDRVSRGEAV